MKVAIFLFFFYSGDSTACGNQVGSFRQEATTYPQPCVLHVLKMKVKALRVPHFLSEKNMR